jgi:hypothetical protein
VVLKFLICILEVRVSDLRQATDVLVVSINLPMLSILEQIGIGHEFLLLIICNYLATFD